MATKRTFNGTRKVIDIPANTGAGLALLATGPVRFVKIEESPVKADGSANTLQNFQYQLPNDDGTFTAAQWIEPTQQNDPAEIGDPMALRGSEGSILGNGPGVQQGVGPTPATTLATLRSASATPTSVTVTQYY